jgi:hypothetical protein
LVWQKSWGYKAEQNSAQPIKREML